MKWVVSAVVVRALTRFASPVRRPFPSERGLPLPNRSPTKSHPHHFMPRVPLCVVPFLIESPIGLPSLGQPGQLPS